MQTNIKQRVLFTAMFATLRVFQQYALLQDHPKKALYHRHNHHHKCTRGEVYTK